MESVMTFRGKYAFLSNMHSTTFEWDGRTYRNSEAAFQSAKSLDPRVRDEFSEMNGVTAKRAGRRVALRGDWERVKDGIMMEVVREKFSQNPELLKKLIDTGDMELVEGNRWHDTYWGVDLTTGEGENHLGQILMEIREELGGDDYLETVERLKAEREEARRQSREALLDALGAVQAQLEALLAPDFTGMTCDTRAFGRVTISRQEGNYLFFEARGAEKRFSLPGCVTQGFLVPEDPKIAEQCRMREALEAKKRELERKL